MFIIEISADTVVLGWLHLLAVDIADIITVEVDKATVDIVGLDLCRMRVDMATAMGTAHFKLINAKMPNNR